ncbi:MAG: thioesterase [Mesorhizobium sp.]|nr:MAG: thioesterase [Mesorhizobium sp.]
MPIPAPFVSRVMDIEKGWIDYNGHLNMAYYNVLFDRCSDEAFEMMGMGLDYVKQRRLTIYTAEVHVCYIRELHLDHKVNVSFQLLDHDDKRLRAYQEIRHVDGWLAATSESLSLHVLAKVETMRAAHAALPMPERAGRSIGIRRKTLEPQSDGR